jgi:hypothetical protein
VSFGWGYTYSLYVILRVLVVPTTLGEKFPDSRDKDESVSLQANSAAEELLPKCSIVPITPENQPKVEPFQPHMAPLASANSM